MNSNDQIESYAALSDWRPQALAGFKVDDLVDLPSLGRCIVVELMPPSLLKVRTATGAVAKVGWRVCQKVGK